jgi:hypothetical protein
MSLTHAPRLATRKKPAGHNKLLTGLRALRLVRKGVARRILSIGLAGLLVWQNRLLLAQDDREVLPPSLKVTVLEGQSAKNNIRKGLAVEPVVLVSDEKEQPVSGVMVVFTLPGTGAGGSFPGDSKSAIVYTNQQGRATARGFKPNSTPGDFQIVVDASFHGLTARSIFTQTNVLTENSKGFSPKLIAILAIAGGAAAAGVVAASGGSSNAPASSVTPARSSTSIVPGVPTFQPPQ